MTGPGVLRSRILSHGFRWMLGTPPASQALSHRAGTLSGGEAGQPSPGSMDRIRRVVVGVLGSPIISPLLPARYDWVTSYKVQFSNDSQTWWGSRNRSSGMDAVSGAMVVGAYYRILDWTGAALTSRNRCPLGIPGERGLSEWVALTRQP